MKNQREEEEETDRLSQLPQHLLHHILNKLFPQQQAVQTCVLSKSWRYLVSTNPRVWFHEKWFTGENKKEAFVSFVDTTLQRYQDQKLSLEDCWLDMSEVDSESKPLLEKWVPILMLNMGVKSFFLSLDSETSAYFDLPSEVFRAQLPLQELSLRRCMLSQINNNISIVDNVLFEHLETLHLWQVYIADETFEKIMSCCPLIADVTLNECEGLKTVKMTADILKSFEFKEKKVCEEDKDYCKIKIDVPTIENISIRGSPNWFHHHCHKKFLHLKDLFLENLRLSTKSFGNFAHNFPCLENLTLDECYGFKEIKLSSSSIERLTITDPEKSMTKVTIHAPNILYFNYESKFLPSSFSFTTASGRRHGWKSDLCLKIRWIDRSSWFFFRLNEMLRALCQSEISLEINDVFFYENDTKVGGLIESVAVENLVLSGYCPRASSFQSFLTMLFRVCRPRNIETKLGRWELKQDEKYNELLCKFLLQKIKGRANYFSQPDLKDVRMELYDDDAEEWPYYYVEKSSSITKKPKTVFRLKWKEKS